MQKVLNLFDFKQKVDYKIEILAGLTVAMTMIPESLSFAILAGFPPLVGLYGAFIMGLITAIFGGRPGLISGGAGCGFGRGYSNYCRIIQIRQIHPIGTTSCNVWFRKRISCYYFHVAI